MIGDAASNTVAVDAIAMVDTPSDVVAVNSYVELPSVEGIASQLPVVGDVVPASSTSSPGLELVSGALDTVPDAVFPPYRRCRWWAT